MAVAEKGRAELEYWQARRKAEGCLANHWYQRAFTEPFGLKEEFFEAKCVLDIGCGPRGSLEWAHNAAVRVGLDPLADLYRELGTDRHKMSYLSAPCERIPAEDASFDIVTSLNSLDHVDDIDACIKEIKRVVRVGGIILLMTDLHQEPTTTEPVVFGWDMVDRFRPDCIAVLIRHLEKVHKGNGHSSVFAGLPYDHTNPTQRYGILVAMLQRLS